MSFKQKRNSQKWNLITLGCFIIICTAMLYYGDYGTQSENATSVAGIPIILGIATIILYSLSRIIGKRYNWIITILGIMSMLIIAIPIFFGAAKHA